MAKKKTTTKKTTKRTAKKTTRKKTSRKKTATSDDATTADTSTTAPENASTTEKSTEEPTARPKRKSSRKSTTRKKSAKKSTRKRTKPADDGDKAAAQVEETNGGIVIRFPPVAPYPFSTPPAVRQPKETAPRDEAEDESHTSLATITRDEVPPPPAAKRPAPETEVKPAPPDEDRDDRDTPDTKPKQPAQRDESDESQLSRSQRRRRRRRRRKQELTENEPPAQSVTTRPATDNDLTGEELVADLSPDDEQTDDVAPWLDDDDSTSDADTEVIETDVEEPMEVEPPEESTTEADDDDEDEDEDTGDPASTDKKRTADDRDTSRRRRRRGGRRSRFEEPRRAKPTEIEPDLADLDEEPERTGNREMIINTVQREECRIAILESGRLEEIYLERAAAENHVGNIYKGVVTNVEPSIQAAFIDFGQGKNGFLHISDLHPQHFPEGSGQVENVGRKMPRRNRPPIQRCVRRGEELLVQVTKEGIGTKGPTLSTYLSIPGRFLVMMPGMRHLGVSRRIEEDDSRDQLRNMLNKLELPDGMGFIARTAALDRSQRELQNDLSYLTRLWRAVEKRIKNDPAPAELYRESDLVIRTIRDVFTGDIRRIVVDDPEVADRAREFLSIFSPRSRDIVDTYTDPMPIFHKHGIEAELERLHSRHVPLSSGGSLVIDQTEALVAIDVNSGRFRTEDDAETTAYKINVEAADEIPRQLRLRDLGGVVVCDFIDMRLEKHRRDIERRLIENLKKHKERAKVLRTSAFGLIELTRQRQRASLTRSVYRDCRHCRGTGLVKTTESVVLDVMRLVQLAVTRDHIRTVEVTVAPEVAYLLQNRKRKLIYELESKYNRIVSIRPDANFGSDQVEISCTDARGRVVPHT